MGVFTIFPFITGAQFLGTALFIQKCNITTVTASPCAFESSCVLTPYHSYLLLKISVRQIYYNLLKYNSPLLGCTLNVHAIYNSKIVACSAMLPYVMPSD